MPDIRKSAEKSASLGEEPARAALWRSLGAELLGTAALTLVAAGGEVIAIRSGGQIDLTARAAAPGLMVMAVIYALGQVSGAHINPAVTLAFALRRDFPWRRVPGYWVAQILGAILAALYLRALFGHVAEAGATRPHAGVGTALAMEIVLTLLLVSIILGTATRAKVVGPNAAIAVGGTVALAGLFAGPISGASMNPARSLGPALVAGAAVHQWIYVVGPGLGAALATLLAALIHGPRQPSEAEAAEGDSVGHAEDSGQEPGPRQTRAEHGAGAETGDQGNDGEGTSLRPGNHTSAGGRTEPARKDGGASARDACS